MNTKLLFIPLVLSLLYFIRKAVQYSLIGSYSSMIIVALFLFLLLISLKKNRKTFLLISRIWGILLITWSSVRILISIMNFITNVFDEYHLNNQFGIIRISLSLIMLSFGILIIRHSHRKRLKDWL